MNTIQNNKKMHIGLWVAQALLGLMFIAAGFAKATQPIAGLSEMMHWPGSVSPMLVRFIGICEFLGGIGLLLPSVLRIKTLLTPYAAVGIATIQILAMVFHISRGEFGNIIPNIIIAGIAIFIYWGRTKKAIIQSK